VANILVIDDERLLGEYFKAVLNREGHTVSVAGNGRDGVDVFMAHHFDMVICDLFMDELDGVQVIEELRQVNTTVPIVAVSGGGSWGFREVLDVVRSLGASAALVKPVSPKAVVQMVNELLGLAEPEPCHCLRAGKSNKGICTVVDVCVLAGSSTWCGIRPTHNDELLNGSSRRTPLATLTGSRSTGLTESASDLDQGSARS
jgi:DNA-binding response OmpR family regulator